MTTAPALLWAPRAWLGERWVDAVALRCGADGRYASVDTGVAPPPGATVLPGPALPALVDAHSHAFQRAFAGLAETRDGGHDDFWSWRDRMYRVARRIAPAPLRAVAAMLQAELLCGGYTQVCEFHYLRHERADDADGEGADRGDPLATARALADAAVATGIGLTLLPTLYERAGFAQPALRPDQRRFAADPDAVLATRDAVRGWRLPRVGAGVAIHSLRAATPGSIARLVDRVGGDDAPIHVHVAEQTAEVDDALRATGARPIEGLARSVALDRRWQLVHATHALPSEIDAVAATGAGVVLCPTTEANLGDGIADLPRWLDAGVPLAIGSDSNVCRSALEELRWLEYGQRLVARRRNVAARPGHAGGSTAARLFGAAVAGGAAAAGLPAWGLVAGARADLLVLDLDAPGVAGVAPDRRLDAAVFATDAPPWREVWVGGERVVAGGRHRDHVALAAAYAAAVVGLADD